MSSPDSTKKRRIALGSGGGDDNGVDDGSCTTMSKILAKLNDMQNELDKCIAARDSMQKEMDGMQNRLSHIDDLEKKCDTLETNCNVLEKKCIHLDTRCESLQRSIQILSKESKWEYSAPPIPLSHWRGFPEDYVDSMKRLLGDIKGYTCALRSGNVGDSTVYLGSDGDVILHYDDILLPHWKELANAMQLYNTNYKLSIADVQLPSQVLDLLAPALKGKPITEFVIKRNEFANNEGTKFITECIKHNNELQDLDWVNNQILNTKDAMLLVACIINHPSITKVQLENCLGGEINSYEVLCPLFSSDTRWDHLDLEGNNIQTKGGTEIPNYIMSNPPLNNLFLADNKLNDDDAIMIAKALKGNTNLEYLRININPGITDIGRTALTKAVYDPTSLNSMSDCNHICQIYPSMGIPIGCSNGNRNLTSSNARRVSKIYHLLSVRNREGSNVKHLNLEFEIDEDEEDNSLKLVPKVLAAIQHYHDKYLPYNGPQLHHSLSITFEVLRGWKMPELYGKRSK